MDGDYAVIADSGADIKAEGFEFFGDHARGAFFAVRELGWPHDPTSELAFRREAPRDPVFLPAKDLERLFRTA